MKNVNEQLDWHLCGTGPGVQPYPGSRTESGYN